jgi:Fe-S-cluster containining protein
MAQESSLRFACTACGKCCCGWLPLTLDEAVEHSDLFPLAIALGIVRRGDPSFEIAAKMGLETRMAKKHDVAIVASPISYIPNELSCPALKDSLCSIHSHKPVRCAAMPFHAAFAEGEQAPFLAPRKGWACEVGEVAPVVYADGQILDRLAFENERAALLSQAEALRVFVDRLIKYDIGMAARLEGACKTKKPGKVVVDFPSFLRSRNGFDLQGFAAKQIPVLSSWAEKTKGAPVFSNYYAYYERVRGFLQGYEKI